MVESVVRVGKGGVAVVVVEVVGCWRGVGSGGSCE